MVMSSGPIIGAADLPASVRLIPSEDERIRGPILSLREMEKRAIHQALDETSGDRMAAARLLQIGKTTLYRKLKEYRANATGP
jgi:two-component system response regulator HydG